MREKVASVRVTTKDDMTRLEQELCRVVGAKSMCSLLRSGEYIRIRLCALYDRGKAPLSAYAQNVQIHLSEDKTVSVFLLSSQLLGDDTIVLGKRKEMGSSGSDDE